MVWRSAIACTLLVGCAAVESEATRESTSDVVASDAYTLSISTSIAPLVDEAFIRRSVREAIDLYAREVAPLGAPIEVVVDAPDCLRTGYDPPTRKVRFCNNTDTPRAGTASADVIHHEVFHALLCQTKPGWCDGRAENVPLHEGLADYFSYALAPDDAFGEGFYTDQAFVRRYRVPYCFSLVNGGHEKGNAIVAELIERGRGFEDVRRVIERDDFSLASLFDGHADACFTADAPHVLRTVSGYPESTLERYRIRPGAPLTLSFAGDAAFERHYANLSIRWDPAPALFEVKSIDQRTFEVSVTGADGYSKVAALYVVDGQVIGGKNFYFQVAQP